MQFQEFEPPSKFEKFMDKYAVPILVSVIGVVLGAVLLGKIFLVDFNLVMLGLGIILTFITGYYIVTVDEGVASHASVSEPDVRLSSHPGSSLGEPLS